MATVERGGESIWRLAWRASWPAVALALVALLPFLDKAFNIDDLTFLLEAQHALVDPLHPAAFDMIFHGSPSRVSSGLVSGPVMAYLLVPSVLRGGAEWLAHLPQIVLLALGAVATAALALRIGIDRRWAGVAALLVVASPAVLAMATTAMPDVPAMTFGVMAMERLCAYRASRRRHAAVTATVTLTLAVLSRPQLVLLVGVGALLLADDGGPLRLRPAAAAILRRSAPLAAALVLLVIINHVTRDVEAAHDVARVTVQRIKLDGITSNLTSFAAHLTLSFPLGLLWAALRGRAIVRTPLHWAAIAAGAGLAAGTSEWGWMWWLGPVCALSVLVLVDIAREAWTRRDPARLALLGWLLIALPTALYVHTPPKYLVPSAPAMAVVLAQGLAQGARPRRWLVGAVAAAGVVLGLLIIRADAALAEVGRRGAIEYVRPAVQAGERVWADGAWGFEWYAMQEGARPLSTVPPLPLPGDIVVRGIEGGGIERFKERRLLSEWRVAEPGGRVQSRAAGAGFYSNGGGYLPWSWGDEELGRIEVWRVGGEKR